MSYRSAFTAALASASLIAFAAPLQAQGDVTFGLRGGLSIDPDGVLVGAHGNIPLEQDRFSIEPQALFGIGSEGSLDYTTIEVGARVRFDFVTDEISAQPFVAGGLAIHRINLDGTIETQIGDFDFGGGSDTDIALQAVGGLEKGPIGGEIVLSIAGRPDIALLFRYTFGRS